jgi:hypothetical protein
MTHERPISAALEGLKLIADRHVTEAGDLATSRMWSGYKDRVPKTHPDKGGANYRTIDRCLISGQVAEIGLLSPARSTR